MRAMILAAGLGTRLRPLTHVRPKALVPIMGATVLRFWFEKLRGMGFDGVVVNAFHRPEQILAEVGRWQADIPAVVRVEAQILGTGGGIRNVLDFFEDEPFVVVNGDVLCDAPLGELARQFLRTEEDVGLLLHDWPVFNNVAVDAEGHILGFGAEARNLAHDRTDIRLQAFTGIHFLKPHVLEPWPIGQLLDIIDVYRREIARGRPPRAFSSPRLFWREMGSVEAYWGLHRELSTLPQGFLPPIQTGQPCWRHPTAVISPEAELTGVVVVGARSRVMPRCRLKDVILWDDVRVEPGSILRNCVVTDQVICSGHHENQTLVGGPS
jgi:mannose-1-phosphate guanylyltransferase